MAQIDTKDKVTVSPPKNEKSSISKIKRDLIHFHIDNNDLSTDVDKGCPPKICEMTKHSPLQDFNL